MLNTRSLLRCAAALAVFCPVSILHSQLQSPAPTPGQQAAVDWVHANSIPLKTVEARNGFADMEPLGKVVGDARIVSLGEATHGTREFFQFKHRMVEYLATQRGFTIFSIEANMPEAYRLNKYVLNGEGDPKQLLKGMYFWTWNTEEVLDMILWMREFNQSGKGRIEFTGFDMQTPTVSIETVRDFLLAHDEAFFHGTVEALYKEVPQLDQEPPQNSFAVATSKLPGDVVAGKHVTIAGFLRSEDIADGYASLWMRADGPNRQPLGFKNQEDKTIRGTTPWKRYEISLDVPADAVTVFFGALQSGSGSAWLDAMEITINGKPYQDGAIDLGFESDTPKGFFTGGAGYEVALDKSLAQSGAQSLRLKRVSSPPVAAARVPDAALQLRCSDVLRHLEQNRTRYVQSGSSETEVDWAIQNARLVQQFVAMKSGKQTRDESMAENIDWIAKHNPGAKIVLWAHNGHVSNTGFSGTLSMGNYLRKKYGKQLVNFGFAFNQGSFRAWEPGKSLHEFTVPPAPEGTLDHALSEAGIPLFALDLRALPENSAAAKWFAEPHKSRSIGAAFSDSLEPNLWSPGPAKADFDVLLFVEKTAAARGNP
ncbi:MAG TPA: erythromycin esterase family protein [Terracidiphilus sp.]|jgi:erythromycin esterase-like protein